MSDYYKIENLKAEYTLNLFNFEVLKANENDEKKKNHCIFIKNWKVLVQQKTIFVIEDKEIAIIITGIQYLTS